MIKTPLELAFEQIGASSIASACGVSVTAVNKWRAKKRLPRTDWTGETNYASQIERLTDGNITRHQLLSGHLPEKAAA